MSCGKSGWVHSRSRSQWQFKMSVNMCLDEIFWTTEHFVTKLGVMMQHHKPECSVENLGYCCQGHSKGSKFQCLPKWYLLNILFFFNQTWYCDSSSWAGVSFKKIGLLFSRSRSQQWFIWWKYDSFYDIFWSADPFATKICLIDHYHKSKCPMKKLDCCRHCLRPVYFRQWE